uniref:WSN domain-containing protein n=1 Tax=Caenorhabditis tropicalis TaxID=1561998 RepID=A0A1I7UDX4_9PELO
MKLLLISLFIIVRSDLLYQQGSPQDQTDAPYNLSQTISQHMKLSRILNAINLQLRLMNKKIDNIDVIAGIWDVDKKAINSLASLRVDALAWSLNSLEQMVNEFPNDIHRIGNVEEISKRIDSVKEITPEKRKALRLAMREDSVPSFVVQKHFPKWNFTVNLADIALQELEKGKNITVNTFKQSCFDNLITSMINVSDVIIKVNHWSEAINETQQKSIDRLVEGYKAAIEVQNRASDLKELSKLLTNIGHIISKFQPLKNMKGVFGMQEQSRQLFNALLQLHQFSNTSLAPAFTSNFNVTTLEESLRDKGIMFLLNKGENLSSLESYLGHIASIDGKITPINQNMKTLMSYDLIDQMDKISRSIDKISKLQNYLNLAFLPNCHESPSLAGEVDSSELQTLADDLNQLLSVVPTILDKLKDIETIREEVKKFFHELEKIEKSDAFEKWLKENEADKVKKALEAAKSVFDGIMQTQDVADSIERLSAGKDKIISIQKKFKEFTALKKECDPLFSFDVKSFELLNDIPDTIHRMKEEKSIQKIKPLMDIIPAFTDDIIELTPSVYEMPKPDPNAKIFKTLNYQDLLDVGICARALENMELIQRYDEYLGNLIYSGVEESIKRMKNQENKARLEKIWGNFTDLRTKLEGIRSNNQNLLEAVNLSGKEKNLGDIFYVYSNLSLMSPSEQVFLHDLRLSMRLFEEPDKKLMESVEKLEKPLATDWQMAHAKMKRLPDILWAINRSFEIFFWKRKDKELGIFEQMGAGWCIPVNRRPNIT